jgi:formylglycine-generating enzyme required for sulfatase activity
MKSNYLKYWRGSLLGMTVLSLATASAFAATSNCKNPTEVTLDVGVKMKFCEIPAGSAAIGSERGHPDEKPVGKRDFKSFQMGQFTVTQRQYKAVLGDEPWKENGQLKSYVKEGNDNPAVYVSYIQAKQFARVMNLIDPQAKYRLPTEAEFEYAARAGTTTEYYWGDEIDPSYAYYNNNTKDSGQYARNVLSCPVPSLDKKYPGYCANGFGLMHMLGNVWQWTADAYVDTYANAPTDGNVPVAGDAGSDRVVRGGSWNFGAQLLRSSDRGSSAPDDRYHGLGFRLVRTPVSASAL